MKHVLLDGGSWVTYQDFYTDLFTAIGAPEWHGTSINALIDTMIWGRINALEPPYTVTIVKLESASLKVREHVGELAEAITEGRDDYSEEHGTYLEVFVEICKT